MVDTYPKRRWYIKSRQGVATASNAYRIRKSTCDGRRPTCDRYESTRTPYQYDTREDSESKVFLEPLIDLFEQDHDSAYEARSTNLFPEHS